MNPFNPLWFSLGCLLGIGLGMFSVVVLLALCRAAAEGDAMMEKYQEPVR